MNKNTQIDKSAPSSVQPLRTGVIGIGSMGRNHVRVLMDMDDVHVIGIADQNLDASRFVSKKYGLPLYQDYLKLLDDQKPQAVVLAVPTVLHHQVAIAALERGIHVLVEKPIAFTADEAREMIRVAQLHHVLLSVGHIERFNPAVIALKERLDAGALGKTFMVHARRLSPRPDRIVDVGVGMDLATHELDIMHYLVGSDITRVSAEVSQVVQLGTREDIIFALLRFRNGVLGILNVNWVTPTTIRELTITGEKGMFLVNYQSQELFFFENPAANGLFNLTDWSAERNFTVDAGNMTRFQIGKREPLRCELEAFVSAVRNGTAVAVDGEAGLRALEIAYSIVSCGNKGHSISDPNTL